ncbi:MAG: hypothetical protein L0229_15190 [Blastocatellia bacterium]|nr:hypothetical protein [Blastocatellia bacterium]
MRKIMIPAMAIALAAPSIIIAQPKPGGPSDLKVDHVNEILQIYVAPERKDGLTIMVFEMKDMKFLFNQRLYSCIFVNGKIVQIREYNMDDSYVRGEVEIGPDEKEVVAYSGVLSHPEQIDPHNRSAMWGAFVKSEIKPFKSRLEDLPEWWVSNPIREKKKKKNS